MATLTDLCNDVYSVTNRPDLVAETKLAVKAATLKLHQSDFYERDIFETGIQFSTADYYQSFDPKTIFPLFRKLKYFRKYDASGTGSPGKFFTILGVAEILDSYGLEKTDIAYSAGTVLNIKSSTLLQYGLLGAYLNPDLADSTYNSWIAVDHPYAIVFEAARLVFKQIGLDENSAAFEKLAAEQLAELKLINIPVVGY